MLDLRPLGESVRKRRLERDLTIKALAKRCGLSARFLSDLENGRGNISIAKLWAVAQALDVALADLAGALDAVESDSIALVGLRGAGKSTIGRSLAERLAIPFVELDAAIEAAAALPLSQIFEIYGEAYYRRLEREVLAQTLAAPRRQIIATGGGIVTDPESWDRLKRHTKTIWLRADPDAHYQRVMHQGDLRPMKNRPSAMAELRALLAARSPLYAEAEVTIDTSALGIEGTVEALLTEAR